MNNDKQDDIITLNSQGNTVSVHYYDSNTL